MNRLSLFFQKHRDTGLSIQNTVMNTDLVAYYKARASEYEKIYLKPEREDELAKATDTLQTIFAGKEVFEIACGTGYWTERIALTAAAIMATDINEEVIKIASQKNYPEGNVQFAGVDFFNYTAPAKYESLFGGFIISHILLQQADHFISTINSFVQPGGTVVLMDNNYVGGSSLPVDETDEFGNTYQIRRLDDGSRHKVLKNFTGEIFLRDKLAGKANNIRFHNQNYYWMVEYSVA